MPIIQEVRCNSWNKFHTFARFRDEGNAKNYINQIVPAPSGNGWKRERLSVLRKRNRLTYPADKFKVGTVWEFVAFFIESTTRTNHAKNGFWLVVKHTLSKKHDLVIVLEQVDEAYLHVKFPFGSVAQTPLSQFVEGDAR